jgi:hypothetical protein
MSLLCCRVAFAMLGMRETRQFACPRDQSHRSVLRQVGAARPKSTQRLRDWRIIPSVQTRREHGAERWSRPTRTCCQRFGMQAGADKGGSKIIGSVDGELEFYRYLLFTDAITGYAVGFLVYIQNLQCHAMLSPSSSSLSLLACFLHVHSDLLLVCSLELPLPRWCLAAAQSRIP